MPRLPPHPFSTENKKSITRGVSRQSVQRPPTKQLSSINSDLLSLQASSGEFYDDTTVTTNICNGTNRYKLSKDKVRAKVDTWRDKPNLNVTTKESKTKFTRGVEDKKRAMKPIQPEQKFPKKEGMKDKAERMLDEINSLLKFGDTNQNMKMSKSYLRSVQKALQRNLHEKACTTCPKRTDQVNGLDPDWLNRIHEPIRKEYNAKANVKSFVRIKKTLENGTVSNARPYNKSHNKFLPKPVFNDIEASINLEIKSFRGRHCTTNKLDKIESENTFAEELRISCDISTADNEKQIFSDKGKWKGIKTNRFVRESSPPSKVRKLMSFWNEKFAGKPVLIPPSSALIPPLSAASLNKVCNDKQRPQSKSEILTYNGVTEEHTLKPSALKVEFKEASSIVEAIKMNSSYNNLHKIESNDSSTIDLKSERLAEYVQLNLIEETDQVDSIKKNFLETNSFSRISSDLHTPIPNKERLAMFIPMEPNSKKTLGNKNNDKSFQNSNELKQSISHKMVESVKQTIVAPATTKKKPSRKGKKGQSKILTPIDILEAKKVKNKVIYTMNKLEKLLNSFPEKRQAISEADILKAMDISSSNLTSESQENELQVFKLINGEPMEIIDKTPNQMTSCLPENNRLLQDNNLNDLESNKWYDYLNHSTYNMCNGTYPTRPLCNVYDHQYFNLSAIYDDRFQYYFNSPLRYRLNKRTFHIIKKINFVKKCFPYLYLVKKLEGQAEDIIVDLPFLLRPGIYRPIPMEMMSKPICVYPCQMDDFNEMNFNLRNYRKLGNSKTSFSSGEMNRRSKKVGYLNRMQPEVMNTLLGVVDKEELNCLNSGDMQKICRIRNRMYKRKGNVRVRYNIMNALRYILAIIKNICAYFIILYNYLKLPDGLVNALNNYLLGRITIENDRVYFTLVIAICTVIVYVVTSL